MLPHPRPHPRTHTHTFARSCGMCARASSRLTCQGMLMRWGGCGVLCVIQLPGLKGHCCLHCSGVVQGLEQSSSVR